MCRFLSLSQSQAERELLWSGLRTHTPCCSPDGRVKPLTAVSTVSEDENITFQLSYPEPIYIFLRGIQLITIPSGLGVGMAVVMKLLILIVMHDRFCIASVVATATSCAAQGMEMV